MAKKKNQSITLPYKLKLRDYQKPVFDSIVHHGVRKALTVWPRRNGKDLIALNILIAMAAQRTGTYLYVGPYATQTRNIIWTGMDKGGRRFIDYIPKVLIQQKFEATKEILLVNGSMIRITGADDPDSMVGQNPIGMVGTEYSLWKDYVMDLMRPIFAENGGWYILNGTARGHNHMYTLARNIAADPCKSGANDPATWFFQYLTRDDTGYPSLEAIQQDREDGMSESKIQQEYYNDWGASGEEAVIPIDLVVPAMGNSKLPSQADKTNVLGVDVAFAAKGDLATICHRQGLRYHGTDRYQGVNNMAFASLVAKKIIDVKARYVFIDAGRGEGVISRLGQMGFGDIVYPVNFGGTPIQRNKYADKRTEMAYSARDWFMGETTPSMDYDEMLLQELGALKASEDNKRKMKLLPKDTMKKKLGRSPDSLDGFKLTFALPVEDFLEDPDEQRRQQTPVSGRNSYGGY